MTEQEQDEILEAMWQIEAAMQQDEDDKRKNYERGLI